MWSSTSSPVSTPTVPAPSVTTTHRAQAERSEGEGRPLIRGMCVDRRGVIGIEVHRHAGPAWRSARLGHDLQADRH